MQLAVMDPTNRHRELVADPPPERPNLGKPEMMRIRRYPRAHEALLSGDEFQVVLVAHANRFPERADRARARGFAGYGRRFRVDVPLMLDRRVRGNNRLRGFVDRHATTNR